MALYWPEHVAIFTKNQKRVNLFKYLDSILLANLERMSEDEIESAVARLALGVMFNQ